MREEAGNTKEDRTTVLVANAQKQNWWNSLTPEQRKLISNIAIWTGISLAAAITIFFGVRFVKKRIANHEKGKTFGDDKWATWADQIHNAIKNDGVWFGTDEKALRKALIAIPSKQDYEKVEKSYRKQFNANMSEAIRKDLSTTEYDEMLVIINSKPLKAKDAGVPIYDPIGWAKRLNAAFNYQTWGFLWGTDIEAIRAVVLEMPSRQAYLDTEEAYQAEYGVSLWTDIKGDLSPAEILEFAELIEQKPYK
ncbi:MAG: hypothetical protein MK086_14260 [Flavobacteriales bacterium]|nr:hypothetical protein [Flavobacteriales bacterium]